MSDILNAAEVRSGTWGQLWLDGDQVAEAYGCQIKVNKTKEDVARCRTLINGKKMTAVAITGTVRIYNATSRLIQLEGVSFDDLTLADWQAAQLGQIEAPFTAEDFDILDS